MSYRRHSHFCLLDFQITSFLFVLFCFFDLVSISISLVGSVVLFFSVPKFEIKNRHKIFRDFEARKRKREKVMAIELRSEAMEIWTKSSKCPKRQKEKREHRAYWFIYDDDSQLRASDGNKQHSNTWKLIRCRVLTGKNLSQPLLLLLLPFNENHIDDSIPYLFLLF